MDRSQMIIVNGNVDYLAWNPRGLITPKMIRDNRGRIEALARKYDKVLEQTPEAERDYICRGTLASMITGAAA